MTGVARSRALRAVAVGLALAVVVGGSGNSLASPRPGSDGRAGPRGGSPDRLALHVIPFPGTPDASTASEIIFETLPARELRSVTVLGSRSGAHAGHLKQLPGSAGTAFTPSSAFDPGELVSVYARLASARAGTLIGAPGANTVHFSFRVEVAEAATEASRPARQAQGGPTRRFHSAPSLHPPAVAVSADPDPGSGDLLLTPEGGSQAGVMILNAHGRLVWFHPVSHLNAENLQVQHYRGRPVLTWWQGIVSWGTDVIVDRSYRTVATVRGAEGYLPDVHEFQITPQGTALIDAYARVRADLEAVGGPRNGVVLDCIIQELDIRTGQLLWEWHALGHVPLTASHAGRPHGPKAYDYFHLNSIEQLPGGDLLVSARNTWAVYKISRATGRVMWSLGGKHSSFRVRGGARFEWQHDARLDHHTLSLFDDGDSPQEEPQSSAKILRIDPTSMTATLLQRYTHSPPLLVPEGGSTQILPNHNVFVGWGGQPDFSEYTPSGRQIFNGTFALGLKSYRAFRSAWTGRPATLPAVAFSTPAKGGWRVYVSWNGATQVTAWRLLGGPAPNRLRTLGRWSATGFETAMRLSGRPRYVKAQALDQAGRLLGSSAVSRSG